MFRFIHAADIHLDSPCKGLETHADAPVAEIPDRGPAGLDNLITLAIDEELDFILIAGDLFDGDWQDFNSALFLADRLGRLRKAGIPVYIVTGNHDAASRLTRTMALPANVTIFPAAGPTSCHLDTLGVAIHGQSYPGRTVSDNLAARFPTQDPRYFNIGLLHTSLNGRAGHEPYAPCTLDDLRAKGYDYWALGHVHKREEVSTAPWVIFPGNLQGRHIRETGAKGATLVTVENGRITEVRHQELDVLRWTLCRVDLTEAATPELLLDLIRAAMETELDNAAGRSLAMRLILAGDCPLHTRLHDQAAQWLEEIHALAAGLGNIWLETVELQTRRQIAPAEMPDDDGPLPELLRAMEGAALDKASLLELAPDLARLQGKLPPELATDATLLFDEAGQCLPEIRAAAKELLIARLGGPRSGHAD